MFVSDTTCSQRGQWYVQVAVTALSVGGVVDIQTVIELYSRFHRHQVMGRMVPLLSCVLVYGGVYRQKGVPQIHFLRNTATHGNHVHVCMYVAVMMWFGTGTVAVTGSK